MENSRDLFWELLEPEYDRAIMFCRKLMGDRDQGDDLFQDALVLAYTRLRSLRDRSAFRPWLYRVMVNAFRSKARRPWWRRLSPLTREMELSLAGDDPIPTHEARRWLRRAMAGLSPDDRALISLYELEGWSVAELAEMHSMTESAVKVRLFRARDRMKKTLMKLVHKDEMDGEDAG